MRIGAPKMFCFSAWIWRIFFANLGANEHMSIVGWPFPSISHTQYHPRLLKISRALPPFSGGKCLLQGVFEATASCEGHKMKNAAKRFNYTILWLMLQYEIQIFRHVNGEISIDFMKQR